MGVCGPMFWTPALLAQGQSFSSHSLHGSSSFSYQLELFQHEGLLANQLHLRCGVCTDLPFT